MIGCQSSCPIVTFGHYVGRSDHIHAAIPHKTDRVEHVYLLPGTWYFFLRVTHSCGAKQNLRIYTVLILYWTGLCAVHCRKAN